MLKLLFFSAVMRGKSVKALKKDLKSLKALQSDQAEISYVSRLIRQKLSTLNTTNSTDEIAYKLHRSFWQTCRDIFNKATDCLPSFDILDCSRYFTDILRQTYHKRKFSIPTWIPSLPSPTSEYSDSPPKYKHVATAINKCKASGSACPFNQLSVIILKRCPILRTLLHKIVVECWKRRSIPNSWKAAATVLIPRKAQQATQATFVQ